MNEIHINVMHDRLFDDSPSAGDPNCLCSRCGQVIESKWVPIRAFLPNGQGEYRYHPACVGLMQAPLDADDADAADWRHEDNYFNAH